MKKFEHAASKVLLEDGSAIEFTAHNIRLDDGTCTIPDYNPMTMDRYRDFVSARKLLDTLFPGDKSRLRLADLGCLEGGYAVEFARLGCDVLGLEVRDSNIVACNYVKSKVDLPNLTFVKDNAWNIASYGNFDAIFCSGLLYHLDEPKKFLGLLASVTKKVAFVHTHFSTMKQANAYNEGLHGHWWDEFIDDEDFSTREAEKWSAWDTRRSFTIRREYLLQAMNEQGFDIVLEQFDCWGPDIADYMLKGYYHTHNRGLFVGIKTSGAGGLTAPMPPPGSNTPA